MGPEAVAAYAAKVNAALDKQCPFLGHADKMRLVEIALRERMRQAGEQRRLHDR